MAPPEKLTEDGQLKAFVDKFDVFLLDCDGMLAGIYRKAKGWVGRSAMARYGLAASCQGDSRGTPPARQDVSLCDQ